MARPKKKGLEYFPLDVDIFEDDKLFDVQNDYGPLGEIIYIRLLCLVYRNGYYYQFESLDKLAAMMIRSIGNRWTKDKKTVKEVILYLAKINLFSSELMHRNVITSRSIQERYLLAVERRQSKIEEYNLLEKNDFHEGLLSAPQNPITVTETLIDATKTSINVSDNPIKESKVNKSKVLLLSKQSENSDCTYSDKIDEIFDLHEKICISYPKISNKEKYLEELQTLLCQYDTESFKAVFEKLEKNSFFKGNNAENWKAAFGWVIKRKNFEKILSGFYDGRDNGNNSDVGKNNQQSDVDKYKVVIMLLLFSMQ